MPRNLNQDQAKRARFNPGVALVIVLAISFVVWLGIGLIPASSQATFKKWLANPVPASVQLIEARSSRGMDFNFQVLHFKISPEDRRVLLQSQHFVPINESEEFKTTKGRLSRQEYLQDWESRIRNQVHLPVTLPASWEISILDENHGITHVPQIRLL